MKARISDFAPWETPFHMASCSFRKQCMSMVHVYGAWIRMIQKGSQRVGAARTGALSGPSCTCMKTTTQSGQAWRGYERALVAPSFAIGYY